MLTYQIKVFGSVQGVGFRFFTFREASKLGITGKAENLADGTVLVIAQGAEEQVKKLVAWLAKGPASASVDKTIVTKLDTLQIFDKFSCY